MKRKDLENVEFDSVGVEEYGRNRKKGKKKRSAGKIFFGFIGVVILLLAVFVITVKLVNPDADLSRIIPTVPREKAVQFIDEKLLGKTTTAAPTTETPTETTTSAPETTKAVNMYLPIEEFALNTAVEGNQLGNLLAGGKAATDMSYLYHIVDGRGIYRFAPSSEGYYRIYKSEDKLSSLNLRGEYIYFVNDKENKLYRLKKGEQKPAAIADNVKLAYVYDSEVFYTTTDNEIGIMGIKELKPKLIFDESTPDVVELIGISLNSVFFTMTSGDGTVSYMTVSKAGGEAEPFRPESENGKILSPVLENGFLYYYEKQDDFSYNLCRQKFGSKKVVTLVEGATSFNPPIVENNRLFYGELDGSRFEMKELNMNSGDVKTMLYTNNASADNNLIIQHGGEYDFIIGKKNDKDRVYIASSMYTGSANIMHFDENGWSY